MDLLLLFIFVVVVVVVVETWKLNKNLESKLMLMKMYFLRRSARCSRLEKNTYNVIRERMNIKNPELDYIGYKQLTGMAMMEK